MRTTLSAVENPYLVVLLCYCSPLVISAAAQMESKSYSDPCGPRCAGLGFSANSKKNAVPLMLPFLCRTPKRQPCGCGWWYRESRYLGTMMLTRIGNVTGSKDGTALARVPISSSLFWW